MKKLIATKADTAPMNWADNASLLTRDTIHPSTNCMTVTLTVFRTVGTARRTTSPVPSHRAGSRGGSFSRPLSGTAIGCSPGARSRQYSPPPTVCNPPPLA